MTLTDLTALLDRLIDDVTGRVTYDPAVKGPAARRKHAERILTAIDDALTRHNFLYPPGDCDVVSLRSALAPQALDEKAQKYIAYAAQGALQMRTMLEGLLALSRVLTRPRELVAVDLTEVLDAVLGRLRKRIAEAGAQITRNALPTVIGDRTLLDQALEQLIDNALEFHGAEPPAIHVSARHTGREASPPLNTFMTTDMRPTRLNSWKIIPMRRRCLSSSRCRSAVRSTPLKRTCPKVGRTRRFIERSSVDLPAPLGPSRTTNSPSAKQREMSSMALFFPE
jgi:hypothetical protein